MPKAYPMELRVRVVRAYRLGLAGEERIAFRQRRSRRVLRRFRQWLEGVKGPPSDPVLKLAKYYVNHWDDLTRFIDHPAVLPLDNNLAYAARGITGIMPRAA